MSHPPNPWSIEHWRWAIASISAVRSASSQGWAAEYILLPRTTTRINRKFPFRNVQEYVENRHFFPSNHFASLYRQCQRSRRLSREQGGIGALDLIKVFWFLENKDFKSLVCSNKAVNFSLKIQEFQKFQVLKLNPASPRSPSCELSASGQFILPCQSFWRDNKG